MKKRLTVLLFFVMLAFSSCVDIEEVYNFNDDGSCNVVYDFDMSRAVSVFMNLMPDSLKATPQFGLVKDTTLNFFNALSDSTRRRLSVNETAMAINSDLNVNMNLNKSQVKFSISHLAKDPEDLQYYLNHLSNLSLDSQFGQVAGHQGLSGGMGVQPTLSAGRDYYSYKVTSNKFTRIIDKVKFTAFLKKTQSALSAAKAMLIDMPYKVVLNFAQPVKKVDNPNAVLSPDRKQVTLSATMDDVIQDPNVMNLNVEF
ncbi:hypothetical protein [Mucilaginibacter auburnensis]|uniref:Fasciclin domain-containing protein n=1 Tax=Mucilaginibacter auburnensis TaxID=1457233 RepID=A0A2H9VMH2_9SPHI|nr:hypothetical protein [Mucilaginibacter auburnensis]PJJ79522.1 hypothetical protein CLV57_2656 [Mucilaginibacter auburnensis]